LAWDEWFIVNINNYNASFQQAQSEPDLSSAFSIVTILKVTKTASDRIIYALLFMSVLFNFIPETEAA